MNSGSNMRNADGKLKNDEQDKYQEPSPSNPTGITSANTILELAKLGYPYIFDPITGLQTLFPSFMFSKSNIFSPARDISSLSGKVILVTGGNAGIGRETILQLAKHDPNKIFLAARNESKANDAITSIKSELDQDVNIEYLPLDLSSLKSVKAAADRFNARSDRLDILILNAGIMAVPQGKTEDGFEIQLGTNHFGHFALTKLLMPILQKTAAEPNSDVRIVSVSSEAHQMAPNFETIISKEKLYEASPWTRYAASKAANILFAAELARRHPNISSTSIHPGLIKTDLYSPVLESKTIVSRLIGTFGDYFYSDIPTGALTQLWTAAGVKKTELTNGAYYTPIAKLRANNKYANDAKSAKTLWDWTEQELAKVGF